MGYLLNDNRVAGGEKVECDTVACRHCRAVIRVAKRQHQGAYCMKCNGPVCDTPACATRCEPFFRTLESSLRRQELWKAIGS